MGHTVCGWAVLMTPWHGNAIRVIGLLWGGNHRRSVDPLHKGPVMHTFDIHLMLTRIKLLNKHSSCRWSKTPLRSCEIIVMGSIVLFNHWPLEDMIVILKFWNVISEHMLNSWALPLMCEIHLMCMTQNTFDSHVNPDLCCYMAPMAPMKWCLKQLRLLTFWTLVNISVHQL